MAFKLSKFDVIRIPASPHVVFRQLSYLLHVLLRNLEVVDRYVLVNPLCSFWLRQNDKPILQAPPQAQLGDAFPVFLAQLEHGFVLEKFVVLSSQRGVSLNCDIVLAAVLNGVAFPKQGMDLKLVDWRGNRRLLEKMGKMMCKKITYSDIFDFALFL